jgi:hypothetical protein
MGRGLLLDADDLEMTIFRARILLGNMTFADLRSEFADRLHAVGQKPKRPRPPGWRR